MQVKKQTKGLFFNVSVGHDSSVQGECDQIWDLLCLLTFQHQLPIPVFNALHWEDSCACMRKWRSTLEHLRPVLSRIST